MLGARFGRKALSATSGGRAAGAARAAARPAQERPDVGRAEESVETLGQRLVALQQDVEAEVAALAARYEPGALALRAVRLAPRKSDIAVGRVGIAWRPWRTGVDGLPTPA
ncbi:MAG: hypothetical protein ACK53C_10975 [Pseudomonadota bacterium]